MWNQSLAFKGLWYREWLIIIAGVRRTEEWVNTGGEVLYGILSFVSDSSAPGRHFLVCVLVQTSATEAPQDGDRSAESVQKNSVIQNKTTYQT